MSMNPSGGDEKRVEGFAGNIAYCERLLEVYNQMRSAPNEVPPRESRLLSHIPEWAWKYYDDPTQESFHLDELKEFPRLQAALANSTSYTPSKWLLEQELASRYSNDAVNELGFAIPRTQDDLVARYARLEGKEKCWPPSKPDPQHPADVYDVAANQQLAGLALSGGGIRSATFCLGILQALAARNLIGRFDYISSISGGGYIHEWLAAWIYREPLGLASVQHKLAPLPAPDSLARAPEQINWLRRYSSYLTPQRGLFSADTWTMGAIWFRNTFLNQIILFSFFAVSLLLVRAVMHPFTMPPFPFVQKSLTVGMMVNDLWQCFFALVTILCVVWAAYGVRALWRALSSLTAETPGGGRPPAGAIGNIEVVSYLVMPGFLLSMIVALVTTDVFRIHALPLDTLTELHWVWARHYGRYHFLLFVWGLYVFALLWAMTQGGRAMESARNNRRLRYPWIRKLAFGCAIAFCGSLPVMAAIYLSVHGYRGDTLQKTSVKLARSVDDTLLRYPPDAANMTDKKGPAPAGARRRPHPLRPQALIALVLPLLFFAAQFTAIRLHLGLLGRSYEESRREWMARYGAWSAIVSFLWLGLGTIALVGPNLYYWLFDSGATRKLLSVGVVALIHGVTLYSGSSSKTSGTPDPRKFFGYGIFDLVGIVGAPIAILSLLVITSGLVDIATDASFVHLYPTMNAPTQFIYGRDLWVEKYSLVELVCYAFAVSGPVLLFLGALGALCLFGWRIDINEFSLNPFYRDRLARCYIGASNGNRVPDPFTGFDDHTEASTRSGISLTELLPVRFGGKSTEKPEDPKKRKAPYDGPMPIFGATANLTFGKDLAYQDRKGTSFAFSPLYTGYHVGWTAGDGVDKTTTYNGFVPTREYAYRNCNQEKSVRKTLGIPLAMAGAISGAALSPNQGFSSQPAVAFLMTLFNVRLGWWIANTRKPGIWPNDLDHPSPGFGFWYLLSELFGYSDDTSNYVSLCDGGRFDNMGLYELIRRRCSLIVICDGEQDDKTTFEGMGLAIAKARIDFGVEISFPPEQIEALTPGADGLSGAHFACGTIEYPAPPSGKSPSGSYTGKIVYLKTAYRGDEPMDLRHYKREHPDFPQESTINQWFTEPQFESYRRLGQLTAEQAIGHIFASSSDPEALQRRSSSVL